MTCIVGIVEKDKVYIGGDSAASSSCDLTVMANPKVFILQDRFIIGYTTSFRMGQIIEHELTVSKHPENMSLYKFMTTVFVNDLRECLKRQGWAEREKDRESGGTFLIGYQGRLFVIQDDYAVLESADNYSAVGSGWSFALGSLFTSTGSAKKRIDNALQSAEKHCPSVRGPFTTLYLKGEKQ